MYYNLIMEAIELTGSIEAVDPPRADESYRTHFIYADQKLHDILVSGNIEKYIETVKEKQINLYNIKTTYIVTKEQPIEQPTVYQNYTKSYKEKHIQNIFDSINRLEDTLNKFKKISKK